MSSNPAVFTALVLLFTCASWCQDPPPGSRTVPIYRVTVIERTVKAVNYQYRSGPTKIDFKGTVLLPQSRGEAIVESKQGRTEIDAKFEGLLAPARFGREYLTYVLWAVTPEGHAKNLGELIAGGSDKAKLHVTTDLQVFGLIVTAEPYSAVRQPSDVVVLENVVRPDTVGRTEPIQVKYELMPRGHYTYEVPANVQVHVRESDKIPMDQYESLLELYQARNAVQIARAMGADRYAADTFGKAERQLTEAERLYAGKAGSRLIVTAAREAAQTAEDARLLAEKRQSEEKITQAQQEAAAEREARARAENEARRASEEAAAARARLDRERAERLRAEQEAARAAAASAERLAPAPATAPQPREEPQKSLLRARLLRQFSALVSTRDTSRGIVVTLPDSYFQGSAVHPSAAERLAQAAALLANEPGLRIEVEGHSDNSGTPESNRLFSLHRAEAVREALLRRGVPASSVAAQGYGGTRPLVSNASVGGRQQNRRVEVVISGQAIGEMPNWAPGYTLEPRR